MYPSNSKLTSSCKESALQLLSRRDHGEYELYQKLLLKGFEIEKVDEAMTYCREHQYLDDLRYAKSQVRQHVAKGHGERRICQELNQKRVSSEIVEQALEQEPQDWFELAKAAAEKNSENLRQKAQKNMQNKFGFCNIEVLALNI
ncbi:Regulatory protein RecX [Vibrio aestuarianus]|nr:Regulatory protein RecX [Vibrio aestuarianus]